MRARIGHGELEVLRYIIDHHPITVREVADHAAETRGVTRTTVLNVMERLRRKGYLTREHQEGLYRYSPAMAKAHLLVSLVRDFVQNTLGGSLEPFVAYMAEDADLSQEELAELQHLIGRLEPPREGSEP